MKEVIIEVTREDICNGTRNSCFKCPIALAVSRALGIDPGTHAVGVDSEEITVELNTQNRMVKWRFPLPEIATRFVGDFDNNQPLWSSFSFPLAVPEELAPCR
jgi:hypothetical protein